MSYAEKEFTENLEGKFFLSFYVLLLFTKRPVASGSARGGVDRERMFASAASSCFKICLT